MSVLVWVLVCAFSAAVSVLSSGATANPTTPLAAALADAQSADAVRHADLLAKLQTEAFLAVLDSPADYAEAAHLRLHVDQVVELLARNAEPSARGAFTTLTSSPVYLANDDRATGLIRASVYVRPLSPVLVKFLDKHSRPDDGFTHVTIDALVSNGTAPAIALLERKFADASHPDEDKVAWMHTSILTHRNDPDLLLGCDHLLRGKLKAKLRPQLVESLYDYRPGEWFRPALSYSPPALEAASADALQRLKQMGAYALKSVALSAEQRAAVQKRLTEVEALIPKEAP